MDGAMIAVWRLFLANLSYRKTERRIAAASVDNPYQYLASLRVMMLARDCERKEDREAGLIARI